MLTCNDVVDMKRPRVRVNWQPAVLTSFSGSLADLPNKVRSHEVRRRCGFLLLRASLALDCMMARKFPDVQIAIELRLPLPRLCPGLGSVSEFQHPSPVLFVKTYR
jgi:hypothetical protein